ncbi:MAG: cellulase family glycosylhydrolase [Fibrobacter sp.]|nr:cellulase family glycosylhydrolase [Fibrobacter sp.]
MKKILAILSMAAVSAMAVSASRVGPVSTYGKLIANGGKLSGSCPEYNNKAVQVTGMSLFWSSGNTYSTDFYSEKGINRLVDDMGIEVVRFAMGAADEKFNSSGRSYTTGGEGFQKALLKSVVNAAVDKDIYVIIDWHIESSDGFTSDAVKFFEYAAKEYGKYNNVIFEIWNEPVGTDMNTVANHANTVIQTIRNAGSDNLVLVGSPQWSSQPDACANAGIKDDNYGCTLHFYAATHYMGEGGYNKAAESAMAKVPVFATEWGVTESSGKGRLDFSSAQQWVSWMKQKGVSWTNWNASAMDEPSAAFTTAVFEKGFSYSESGENVKGYMNKGVTYKDCGLQNGSSEEESGFSTGVANGATTSILDDMEDGDRYGYLGGAWAAVEDQENGGASSISNDKLLDDFGNETYQVVYPVSGDSKNTSKYMAALKDVKIGKGTLDYGPYIKMFLTLLKEPAKDSPKTYADFAKCKTIKYKYKGASHNFAIETTDVTDYNYHRVNKDASEDWKEVEITTDMLKQETWGDDSRSKPIKMENATRLSWEIKGLEKVPDNMNQPKYPYLYIDDVKCDGLSFTAVSGGSGDTPKSSSSVGGKSSSSNGQGGKSSSSVAPTLSSSSVAPVITDLMIIDDVEDGDEVLNTEGTWYAYTDNDSKGKSSITNVYDATLPGYVVVFPGTADPTNGTKGFVGLTGIVWDEGEYKYDPFVALGLNTNADTSKGIDLSTCPVISYRYKGSAHTIKLQDGQVEDYAYHSKNVLDAADWTQVTIAQADFKQPSWADPKIDLNWANIKKMAWEVIGVHGISDQYQPTYNFLYLDDLKCVNTTVGVMARKAASQLKLSVNGDMLNVVTTAAARIQVFDMQGNMVMNRLVNAAGNHQVSFAGKNRGNYIVRVKTAMSAQTARISIR